MEKFEVAENAIAAATANIDDSRLTLQQACKVVKDEIETAHPELVVTLTPLPRNHIRIEVRARRPDAPGEVV
jgi:hypothetical protein